MVSCAIAGDPHPWDSMEEILDKIARIIKQRIVDVSRQTVTWSSHYRAILTIKGTVIARSPFSNQESVAVEHLDHLFDLDGSLLQEMMNNIGQSNATVSYEDITWEFHVDPSSVLTGAARKPKKPVFAKDNLSWHGHEDVYGDINCAAIALTLAIKGQRRQYHKYPDRLKEDAREFQNLMGWESTVSLMDLKECASKLEYTIIVMFKGVRDFSPWAYGEGPRIFLYYDETQNHYAFIPSPTTFVMKLNNKKNLQYDYTN